MAYLWRRLSAWLLLFEASRVANATGDLRKRRERLRGGMGSGLHKDQHCTELQNALGK